MLRKKKKKIQIFCSLLIKYGYNNKYFPIDSISDREKLSRQESRLPRQFSRVQLLNKVKFSLVVAIVSSHSVKA